MKVVFNDNWNYTIFEDGERLYLLVLCGTIGVFERLIELHGEEIRLWKEGGVKGLMPLIESIRNAPQKFDDRHIRDDSRHNQALKEHNNLV